MPSNTAPGSIKRWRNNYDTLTALRNVELPFSVPKPILLGNIMNQAFSVETKLYSNRKLYNKIGIKKGHDIADHAVNVLISLYDKTGKTSAISDESFKKLINDPLKCLIPNLSDKGKDRIKRIEDKFARIFG